MNNEIKEILDNLKDTADTSFFAICGTKEELENMPKSVSKVFHITDKHAKVLLDYITNLQQENEELKKKLDRRYYKNEYERIKKENERLKETNVYCNRTDCVGRIKDSRKYDSVYQEKEYYKSRCEKAIEYIKNNSLYTEDYDYDEEENLRWLGAYDYKESEDLLNILQNGGEEK